LGECADPFLAPEVHVHPLQTRASVDVDLGRGIHQYIGDACIGDQVLERAGPGQLPPDVLDEHTQSVVRQHQTLGSQGRSDLDDASLLLFRDQTCAHAIEERHERTDRHSRA